MSVGINDIRYSAQDAKIFYDSFISKSRVYTEALNELVINIQKLIETDNFEGNFANASRSYLTNAVVPVIDGFIKLLEFYEKKYTVLYIDSQSPLNESYAHVYSEGSIPVKITTNDLTNLTSINDSLYSTLEDKLSLVNTELDNVSDLVSIDKITTSSFDIYGLLRFITVDMVASDMERFLKSRQEALNTINDYNTGYDQIVLQISSLSQMIAYMDGININGISSYDSIALKNSSWYSGLISSTAGLIGTYSDDYFISREVPPALTPAEELAFANIVAEKVESRDEEWFNNVLNNSSSEKLSYYSVVLANQSTNSELFSDRQNNLVMMSNVFSSASGILTCNYTMGVDNLGKYIWKHPSFEITFDKVDSGGKELVLANLTYDLATGVEYTNSSLLANGVPTSVRRGMNILVVPGSLSDATTYNVGKYVTELIDIEGKSGISKTCIVDENAKKRAGIVANVVLTTGLTIATGGLGNVGQVAVGVTVTGLQYIAQESPGSAVEENYLIAKNSSSANDTVSDIVETGQTAVITNFDNCFTDGNDIYVGGVK